MPATATKPSCIIDSSIILAHFLPDEALPLQTQATLSQFKQDKINLFAPSILKYEVANSLRSSILRKRIIPKVAQKLLKQFLALPIKYQPPDFPNTLKLAIKHNLSIYDAAYLHLAKSQKAPFLSLDITLVKLAQK